MRGAWAPAARPASSRRSTSSRRSSTSRWRCAASTASPTSARRCWSDTKAATRDRALALMDVTLGDGAKLSAHGLRAAVLGEVHARPFTPIETPRRVLHFAFDTAGERAKADRTAFTLFCKARGLDPVKDGAKQHRIAVGGATLRWEQHSEFTTYTWEMAAEGNTPFYPAAAPMAALPQPGPLVVALDVLLMAERSPPLSPEKIFDRVSLAVAENADGNAVFATDF